ncbi:TPA: hypothetical protein ACVU5D_002995 [Vibrio parahaemolyticus]
MAINALVNSIGNSDFDKKLRILPDLLTEQNRIDPPSDDFVLCRDRNGKPTAIFGSNIWDFNPYRTSATRLTKFSFSTVKGVNDQHTKQMIDDIKWLMFCIIYKSGSGQIGRITATTLYNYFRELINISKVATQLSYNRFTGEPLQFRDFFCKEVYISTLYARAKKKQDSLSVKMLNSVFKRLHGIGKDKLGFSVRLHIEKRERGEDNQHPIIPASIYLHYINHLTDELDRLTKGMTNITNFLSEFSSSTYGLSKQAQKSYGIRTKNFNITMSQAIDNYQLNDVFGDVKYKRNLTVRLREVQFTLKNIIHLYTGMRDQEILRLPYDCLYDYTVKEEEKDDDGKVVVPTEMIKLVSTTTKYTGYQKEDSWYAPKEVVKAINLLRKIALGMCKMKNLEPKECPLFLNVALKRKDGNPRSVTAFSNVHKKTDSPSLKWYTGAVITKHDMEILQASEPDRDFYNEKESSGEIRFKVGGIWPLTSHQFRRSLAFYASNSGFVSIPTLKRQYKHLTKEITKYYARNYQNVESIFGHYDPKTGKWKLPEGHVIFDCQAAVPVEKVNNLIDDIIGSDSVLFGKSGSYISRQSERIFNGEVQIEEFRESTLKKVYNGEIAYNETLLGGCTNSEGCDCRILGEFTDCLGSECAVIKKDKVERQIREITESMKCYKPTDGEYQILEVELNSLLKFKKYRMNTKEASNE